jgi:glutamate N-acetyltransferase/amino-acid N-acetyltransferase
MTTDTKVKQAMRIVRLAGKNVTIAGAVKGAGMIGPQMATTLCFLATDAAISSNLLAKALKAAIDQTLNRLTVDGLQSTNDTAFILASGLAMARPITRPDRAYQRFCDALFEVCQDLVMQMGLDAEGATRMFKVVVCGAATKAEARRAARAVADYPLVKCAVHGGDPNWGRIICAVGSSGVRLDPTRLSCRLDQIYVFRNGRPCRFDRKAASAIIQRPFHTITVLLGVGKQSEFCYGVDLSKDYVRINAEYHT